MPMLKAVEMKVVTASNAETIGRRVTDELKKGYTLHGDLKMVLTTGNVHEFAQAVVKVEPVMLPGENLGRVMPAGAMPIITPP